MTTTKTQGLSWTTAYRPIGVGPYSTELRSVNSGYDVGIYTWTGLDTHTIDYRDVYGHGATCTFSRLFARGTMTLYSSSVDWEGTMYGQSFSHSVTDYFRTDVVGEPFYQGVGSSYQWGYIYPYNGTYRSYLYRTVDSNGKQTICCDALEYDTDTQYMRGWLCTTIADLESAMTTGSTPLTRASTYSTSYLTRASTSQTSYLTRASTSGYSGVSSSSSSSEGWQ